MIKSKKNICLLLFFVMFVTALTLSFFNATLAAPSLENNEKFHISSLFTPKTGSIGNEEALQATSKNLPSYLSARENNGAVLYLNKNIIQPSALESKKFAISDNTKNDVLVRMQPTQTINKYDTLIKEKGANGADIDVNTAVANNIYWPSIRDITLTIADANNPDIFIKVFWFWRADVGSASYAFGNMMTRSNNQNYGGLNHNNLFRTGAYGGALVPVSYWGNLSDTMEVYYDFEENSLYCIKVDAGGNSLGKQLLRNFNDTYGVDAAWGGFKSDFVTISIEYAGGDGANKAVLVTDIDGVNLATDDDGCIKTDAIESYNNIETSYEVKSPVISLNEGLKDYSIPMLIKANMFTTKLMPKTVDYTINVLNSKHEDITETMVKGLNNGRWTENSIFSPVYADNYTFKYTKGDIVLETTAAVKNNIVLDDIFEKENSLVFVNNQMPPSFMSGGQGLGLEISRNTTLSLKTPISLSNINSSVPIISYLVTPKSKKDVVGKEELQSITLTLTDVKNPNNYIKIKNYQSKLAIGNSFVSVAANNQNFGGVKQNRPGNPFESEKSYGTASSAVFTGVNSMIQSLYYYDNKVYAMDLYSENQVLVRDFNDKSHLLSDDKIFSGFESDLFNLSIDFDGVSEKTGVIIYNIAGQQLGPNFIDDKIKPNIIIEEDFYFPNLPKGEVDSKFILPSATASDMISGNLTDKILVEVYKDYETLNQSKVEIKNGYFIPETAGTYNIVYSVYDDSLNYASKVVSVNITEKLPYINIIFDSQIPEVKLVGQNYQLPNVTVENGSGNFRLKVEITDPDGEIKTTSKKIIFDKQGIYKISYTVTDWLGNIRIFEKFIKSIYAESNSLEIEEAVLPKAVVSGKNIVFPMVKAYDRVSYFSELVSVSVKIFVSENDGEFVQLGVDRIFNPSSVNGKLNIEYRAKSILFNNISSVKKYEISIINPNKTSDFFIIENELIETKYITSQDGFYKETLFTAKTNGAKMHFANKMPSNNFSISLENPELSKYTKLTLTLQDSQFASQKVSFILEPFKNNQSFISFLSGEERFLIEGNLYTNTPFKLRLFQGESIYDKTNTLITNLISYDSGEKFTGFNSGMVYLAITFDGIEKDSKADLLITNLCNQPGIYEEINDLIPPMLVMEYNINSYYNLGDTIILPKAYGNDLLDAEAFAELTIMAPDGTIILDGITPNINVELKLTSYGFYKVIYTAYNSSGNFIVNTIYINAFDEIPPIIEFNGTINSQYKKGEKIKKIGILAKDNITETKDLIVKIYLIDEKERVKEISEDYIFENSGNYILRFFVQDQSKNYTIKNFDIKVQ